MRYALINLVTGHALLGDKASEIVSQIEDVKIDLDLRCAVIKGRPDTVTFSSEFGLSELPGEISKRVIDVYVRDYKHKLYQER